MKSTVQRLILFGRCCTAMIAW